MSALVSWLAMMWQQLPEQQQQQQQQCHINDIMSFHSICRHTTPGCPTPASLADTWHVLGLLREARRGNFQDTSRIHLWTFIGSQCASRESIQRAEGDKEGEGGRDKRKRERRRRKRRSRGNRQRGRENRGKCRRSGRSGGRIERRSGGSERQPAKQ